MVQNTGLRIFTRYGRSSPSPITKNSASPRESSVLAYPSPSARRGGFTRYGPVFGIFSRACRMILHDSFSSLNRHSNRAYESPAPPSCHTCGSRSEEHTSELQSQFHLVCRLLLEKKKNYKSQFRIN